MNPNEQVIPQKSRFALNVKKKIPDKIEPNEPDKIKPNDEPILDNNKEKEIVENKGIVDYGEERLNSLFKGLDLMTQEQILRYPQKEVQIEILKDMLNPELTNFWNKLTEKEQKQLTRVNVRVRYKILKEKLEESKNKVEPVEIKQPAKIIEDINEKKPWDSQPMLDGTMNAPNELFGNEESDSEGDENPQKKKEAKNLLQTQQRFEKIIQTFYELKPYSFNANINHELEVKFGTKGIKNLWRFAGFFV